MAPSSEALPTRGKSGLAGGEIGGYLIILGIRRLRISISYSGPDVPNEPNIRFRDEGGKVWNR